MIKKLKRKFVLLVMLALFIVLGTMALVINIINYKDITNYYDDLTSIIVNNNGILSEWSSFDIGRPRERDNFSKETPFETRFFTIKFSSDGKPIVNTSQIASIDAADAVVYAGMALDKNRNTGFIDYYRYRVSEDESIVVFVDCQRQLRTFVAFANASILILACVMLLVLALIIILSKKILKPFIDNYNKQQRFITDASHELKTPLAIISANNELIELENGENENTQTITKQINKLNSMIKSMITLASINENDTENHFELFNLSNDVIDLKNSFTPIFESNNKKLDFSIEDNISLVGNEKLIRQLISILLENAAKYSISFANINLYKSNNIVTLSLENDAAKIDEENFKNLFERFYRSDSARASSISGSGIGLSIAKEICLIHNAQIDAKSDDDAFKIMVTFTAKNKKNIK